MRRAAVVLAALTLLLTLATPVATAWPALRDFKGDRAYLLYEVSYVVTVVGQAASGEARGTYLLHILIEKYNSTHYTVSALADSVTYSFTSDDPVFLHVLANNIYTLYLPRRESRVYFIALLNLASNAVASVTSRLGASIASLGLQPMNAVFVASTVGRLAASLVARARAPKLAAG